MRASQKKDAVFWEVGAWSGKERKDAKAAYDECIEKLDDETAINILQSISNEEKGHIELAKRLIELIQE